MDVDSHKHTTDAASHHHCDDVTLVSHHLAVHDDVIRLKLWIYICGYIYGYRQPQPYRRWCGQPLEACVRAETARQSTTASEFHMSHHHTTCHIIIPHVTSSYHKSHHHTTCHIIIPHVTSSNYVTSSKSTRMIAQKLCTPHTPRHIIARFQIITCVTSSYCVITCVTSSYCVTW